jgi:hypothetical protein
MGVRQTPTFQIECPNRESISAWNITDFPGRKCPPLTIVTAADRFFFRTLQQFLKSCVRYNLHGKYRIIIYDLGLSENQKHTLNRFIAVHDAFELRRYPGDFDAHVVRGIRRCVWKPTLIDMALHETKATVLWLDAATLITGPLDEIERHIECYGCFTPYSGNSDLQRWTHEDTLRFMRVEPEIRAKRNRCGGVCGFDYRHEAIRELTGSWKEYALIDACIAPDGADRSNHRFDQSILSILLYRFEKARGIRLTDQEVDIGSTRPLTCLSVRNYVPDFAPSWLDPLCRLYFYVRRMADITLLKQFRRSKTS